MLQAIRRRAAEPASSGRYVLISALVLAVPGRSVRAARPARGSPCAAVSAIPARTRAPAYSAETQILTSNGTYGTRQSNKKKGDGGGAIYGCRSAPRPRVLRARQQPEDGRAFSFQATNGTAGGAIQVGRAPPTRRPCRSPPTPAGPVANLNADRVDDLHAADIVAQAKDLWAVVGADGALPRKNAATSAAKLATGEYQVVFDRNVTACAYNVTLGSTDTTEAPAGEAGASQRAGNANAVAVVTRDSAGAKADRPFHLTVNC